MAIITRVIFQNYQKKPRAAKRCFEFKLNSSTSKKKWVTTFVKPVQTIEGKQHETIERNERNCQITVFAVTAAVKPNHKLRLAVLKILVFNCCFVEKHKRQLRNLSPPDSQWKNNFERDCIPIFYLFVFR